MGELPELVVTALAGFWHAIASIGDSGSGDVLRVSNTAREKFSSKVGVRGLMPSGMVARRVLTSNCRVRPKCRLLE